MIFDDYDKVEAQEISPSILWEYDPQSPEWDWNKMAVRVVERTLLYGREKDYYARYMEVSKMLLKSLSEYRFFRKKKLTGHAFYWGLRRKRC